MLRLSPKSPRSLILPLDVFFQSMATHHGRHAVGQVLSDTGSDSARAAGAINEAGGFLLEQAPEYTKFDGMPVIVRLAPSCRDDRGRRRSRPP